MNARWAMMAVAGICTTEILGIGGPWYEAGAAEYDLPINALLAVQFPVMGILELRRIRGWLATGKSGVNETFPWDPMGMNGDQMALKEVKNREEAESRRYMGQVASTAERVADIAASVEKLLEVITGVASRVNATAAGQAA